jgi:hypothetical protein
MKENEVKFEEPNEENWFEFGPHMELSVLSQFPWPDEWRTKYKDNKAIEPEIPEGAILKNEISFVKKIIEKMKIEFKEIEFKEDFSDNAIELLCDRKEECIFINININVGIKRYGRISFRIYGNPSSYLNTKIYFLDELDYKCRQEINSIMGRLIKITDSFCGTIGLEADVWDIFKLDELSLQIGDQENYGIENIFWKIPEPRD